MKQLILFDMDGVLVDVRNSYLQAIAKTYQFFTKEEIEIETVERQKKDTGNNNDWDLTYSLISAKRDVQKESVISKFQELLLGTESNPGLFEEEKLIIDIEMLNRLSQKFSLGIVTGRPRMEALRTLGSYKIRKYFSVLVAMEDCGKKQKPDPYGIKSAMNIMKTDKAVFLGDSIDDIKGAVSAGIPAFGIVPPGSSKDQVESIFLGAGAAIVLDNINSCEGAIKWNQ